MPVRRFDGHRLLLARREEGLKQTAVAAAVEVSAARVSAWETGRSVPDPEKLPRLARAVNRDLDALFPRPGPPDLADLRADAGYSQSATRELTATRTQGPVAAAENGQRRLAREYEQVLADAYGVSVETLRRAQERSFGHDVPEPGEPAPRGDGAPALPATLDGRIAYLLGQLPQPLPDAEIAARGNRLAGRQVLDEDLVREMRTGVRADAPADVLGALAEALDTTAVFFESGDTGVQQVIAETMVLKNHVAAIAARGGGEEGLSAQLLAFINREVAKARAEAEAEAEAGGGDRGHSASR
ncbi:MULTISPECIES: helix-turn-helix transcriptional regulator [unclassified Streptomyces]|uniref:helix-turn-helix transcriptional regulator n=1 Tax=unclassified Streptomyces TaxID=2593676 RepID=UPI0036333063